MQTPSADRFHLEVRRGRTLHPSRPIDRDDFRIGSGPDCQVRLGDESVPQLLCTLTPDRDAVRLDSTVPVILNGRSTQGALLVDGDVLEFSGFEFALRDAEWAVEAEDTGELSAAELVELLESDMEMVEAFESGREDGADAVFEAIRERRHEAEIEFVTSRLEALAAELEQREEELVERELQLKNAADELQELQEELDARMAALEQRLADDDHELRRAA